MKSSSRLIFIDVIRAVAICMMLEGHFVDGLLAPEYRDENYPIFVTWLYIRGMTAPVFFTVSGFIFTYLLIKEQNPEKMGWNHIRVQKGLHRGISLVIVGYLLRANIFNLFSPYTDLNVRKVDVLHCIGLSLLFLIVAYLVTYKRKKHWLPYILLFSTLVLFIFEPIYRELSYDYLPLWIANYFTKINGSIFTIFPWFGYTSLGGFMGYLFYQNRNNPNLYPKAIISCLSLGCLFLLSPYWLGKIAELTNYPSLWLIAKEDFLIKRVGNVLLFFAVFMLLRNIITSPYIQKTGQKTLTIYILHYIILYGSFTGLGLYRFFHNKLNPIEVTIGAFFFVLVTILITFVYMRYEERIDDKIALIEEKMKRKWKNLFN